MRPARSRAVLAGVNLQPGLQMPAPQQKPSECVDKAARSTTARSSTRDSSSAKVRSSPEGMEGVSAFLEKRRASFLPPEPEPQPEPDEPEVPAGGAMKPNTPRR